MMMVSWKKYAVQIIALLVLVWGAFFFLGRQVPCKDLITYRIGMIDPRFDIDVIAVQKLLADAEKPWEHLAGRDLLALHSDGEVVVNFIYDERQARTQEEIRLDQVEAQVDDEQSKINTSYESQSQWYEKRSQEYEARVRQYEIKLEEYNADVKRFNKTGDATTEDIQRLEKEAKNLDQEMANIEQERLSLNSLAESINNLAGKEEKLVAQYNEKVADFEKRFPDEGLFDQGDFGGNELNIYQFKTADDLRVVLTHEFGHTLGLDHVENPQSVMYYLMNEQSTKDITLSGEDEAAFRAICEHSHGLTWGNVEEIIRFIWLRADQVTENYVQE